MPAFSLRPPADRLIRIELHRIHPSPHQPRRSVDEAGLRALAESIRQVGLLNPLLVRRAGEDFQLIAGERRLRALQMLGHSHAEAIVTAACDPDSALIGLIENLQREDLHFLDQAEACRRILREQGVRQDALAAGIGKSPSALANLLRLLRLGRGARAIIRQSHLSERHARALLKLTDETQQLQAARAAAKEGWSVRQLEAQIDRYLQQTQPSPPSPAAPLAKENLLVINALRDTVRQLKRIGVPASSRVEAHEGYYDVIVTIRTPGGDA